MKGMGAIKNIEPIIDIEIIENQIPALVFLKKNLVQSIQIADELAAIPEASQLYMATGGKQYSSFFCCQVYLGICLNDFD
jgi:hypothetical protein